MHLLKTTFYSRPTSDWSMHPHIIYEAVLYGAHAFCTVSGRIQDFGKGGLETKFCLFLSDHLTKGGGRGPLAPSPLNPPLSLQYWYYGFSGWLVGLGSRVTGSGDRPSRALPCQLAAIARLNIAFRPGSSTF